MAASNDNVRRTRILETATGVFLRYGLRKTSMDDLARAAGLSRQALYLHFATKEDLFRAALIQLLDSLRSAERAALAREDLPFEDRVVAAFEAVHAHLIGSDSAAHMSELLEAATEHLGGSLGELETTLVADVARALKSAGIPARWKHEAFNARTLAEHLSATSMGLKHSVATREHYRERMRIAVRIACRGEVP